MKNLLILLGITLLASCSVMEKAGIEKRRYSAGYYIPPLFAKNKPVRKNSEIGEHAKSACDGKMETITPLLSQSSVSNDLASLDKPEQQASFTAVSTSSMSTSKENFKVASFLNNFSPKVLQDYAAKRSTLAFTDRKSLLYRGCGHGCGALLAASLLILLILFLLAISPYSITPGIIFIACGVILLFMLIAFLVRESVRAAHREERHNHWH